MRSVSKNRRTFLERTFVGVTACMGFSCRANAGSPMTLTMVTTWPKGAPGVGVNAQHFADRVTQMSGGRRATHWRGVYTRLTWASWARPRLTHPMPSKVFLPCARRHRAARLSKPCNVDERYADK